MRRGPIIAYAVTRALVGLVLVPAAFVSASAAPRPDKSDSLFPPAAARELDAAMTRILAQDNLPSVAVRAAAPDRGRYVFVSGLADLRSKARRRAEQPFRIASLTKTFVATAVLQLVDDGKL